MFVSIVSTKIPFKGAGKEYIGDDIEEMVGAVKQAIQSCCVQLKVGCRVHAALIRRQLTTAGTVCLRPARLDEPAPPPRHFLPCWMCRPRSCARWLLASRSSASAT